MASGKSPLGVGRGRGGMKRHKGIKNKPVGLNKGSVKRLARRAGVKRINAGVYEEAPSALRTWLKKIVQHALILAEHGRRVTVTLNDILLALKRNGITLYGFNMTEKRERIRRPLERRHLQVAAQRVAARQQQAAPVTAPSVRRTRARINTPEAPIAVPPAEHLEVSVERSSEIQTAVADYLHRHERYNSGGALKPKILEWVNANLQGANKIPCSKNEFDVVLEGLNVAERIVLDGNSVYLTS